MPYLLIFLGAGLGGVLRFFVSTNVQAAMNGFSFPFGTLAVNVLGCLLIGLLGELAQLRGVIGPETRLFLLVGILGGFTTFSSFGFETIQLLRDSQLMMASLNVVAQNLTGLLAVWVGCIIARFFFG